MKNLIHSSNDLRLLASSVSLVRVLVTVGLLQLTGCGGSRGENEDGGDGSSFAGSRINLTSSLIGQIGTQAQMATWLVALNEQTSGVSIVAQADNTGTLGFQKVSQEVSHSAVLLSPDYIIQAVLGVASDTSNQLNPYFKFSSPALPRIVQKGGSLSFQTNEGVLFENRPCKDSNGDGIPDGASSFLLSPGFGLLSSDLDEDGIDNELDQDVDGDCIPNAYDSDDDGDGVADLLDTDANGDGELDILQENSDQHFSVGLKHIVMQIVKTPTTQTMKFLTQTRPNTNTTRITIRGPASLFGSSIFTQGDGLTGLWDYSLADDGRNDDGIVGDGVYSRTVTLATGMTTRANQIIFFQQQMGTGADAFTAEFPFLIPNVQVTTPTLGFDGSSRTVTLSGDPFGAALQDFTWLMSVTHSSGIKVFESAPISGTTRTFVLPTNAVLPGNTYILRAVAQTPEKVKGYPGIIVQSADSTVNF